MKVLNFGSMNVDHVYQMDHIILAGETESSGELADHCGGKGLNQSIALSRAGVPVIHAGLVGKGGDMLLAAFEREGVDTSLLRRVDVETGHTVIQVDKNGQNSIILFGGSNRAVTREYVEEVLSQFGEGDLILLQNELNELSTMIDLAYEKKMQIVLNPSPFDERLSDVDLAKVSLFLINEIEGEQLTGEKEPRAALAKIRELYPNAKVVLTQGSAGAYYMEGDTVIFQEAEKVQAVDTTAAGDTFTGYFIASMLRGMEPAEGLALATKAAAVTVTRKGAADSIPRIDELEV